MMKRLGDEVAQGSKDSKMFEQLYGRESADLIDQVDGD